MCVWKEVSIYHLFSRLTLEEKFEIVRSVGEECIQEDELRTLLALKPEPICYDGFEPSGRMHIAQVTNLSKIRYFLFLIFFFFDVPLLFIYGFEGNGW